jgi:hypothetical protein
MDWSRAPIKGLEGLCSLFLHPFCHVRTQGLSSLGDSIHGTILEAETALSLDMFPPGILMLNFLASRTLRNNFYCL